VGDVLGCEGCEDDGGGGSDNVEVLVVFTTLTSPTQLIILVVDVLGIEPFNVHGLVGGITPGKLVIARGVVGADGYKSSRHRVGR
jgi:hypothetical protein